MTSGTTPPVRPSVRVTIAQLEVSDYFEHRDAAQRAHATQIDPDGFFFAMPREVELAEWPTEEYELAQSRVPTNLPEDDLFAGLRGGTS